MTCPHCESKKHGSNGMAALFNDGTVRHYICFRCKWFVVLNLKSGSIEKQGRMAH